MRAVQQQLAARAVVVLVGAGVIAGPQVGQADELHATRRAGRAHALPGRLAAGRRGLRPTLSRANGLRGPVGWLLAALPGGSRHPQSPGLQLRKLPVRLRQPPGHHFVVTPQPAHVVLDAHAVRDLARGALDVPGLAGRDQHHVPVGRGLGHSGRSPLPGLRHGIACLHGGLPSRQPDGQRHDRRDFHARRGSRKRIGRSVKKNRAVGKSARRQAGHDARRDSDSTEYETPGYFVKKMIRCHFYWWGSQSGPQALAVPGPEGTGQPSGFGKPADTPGGCPTWIPAHRRQET